jgi:repressor LexA
MKRIPLPLTLKEKSVLEFIEVQLSETGVSPSYQEIRDHFGFASFNSVQNYLKQLSAKGYVAVANNQKRAIQVLHSAQTVQDNVSRLSALKKSPQEPPRERFLQSSREEVLSLPLLGHVAAGAPIEALEHDEFVDIPPSLVRNTGKTFALKVKGNSMIEDGIFNGDIILVQKQTNASNGEIVVASIDNESTVKRIYSKGDQIELRPANSSMESMWYSPQQVQIQGVVVGLLRKF